MHHCGKLPPRGVVWVMAFIAVSRKLAKNWNVIEWYRLRNKNNFQCPCGCVSSWCGNIPGVLSLCINSIVPQMNFLYQWNGASFNRIENAIAILCVCVWERERDGNDVTIFTPKSAMKFGTFHSQTLRAVTRSTPCSHVLLNFCTFCLRLVNFFVNLMLQVIHAKKKSNFFHSTSHSHTTILFLDWLPFNSLRLYTISPGSWGSMAKSRPAVAGRDAAKLPRLPGEIVFIIMEPILDSNR